MILGQSLYQTVVLLGGLVCLPRVDSWFGWSTGLGGDDSLIVVHSIIFNAFIFCQLFNLVACRRVSDRKMVVVCSSHNSCVGQPRRVQCIIWSPQELGIPRHSNRIHYRADLLSGIHVGWSQYIQWQS